MEDTEELYRQITETLIAKGLTVSTMESATSGLIASLITDTEGASAALKGAFITYSNEAKIMQGVPQTIIDNYGVYSKETAEAMAKACKAKYKADIGIGITGTFGNVDPGNPDSVPGEIYFSIDYLDTHTYFQKLNVCNSRNEYKLQTADIVGNVLKNIL